ncbi:MAG: pseudouridine-5'-phosphate glycosidase [Candidatus Nanopelagicales bacterium]|jgi:pseudouridylate synthase|nr:pseudouridine-5'-phosphate glycosidase [Candidatus Nanopelagicales bacterium]MDP4864485.1 pseudouridine-5'-phosphate glycosidase [Candidatus Nanopelagicaceae bacterium]MDP4652788.1 pseudouridine-5'-phosphate glycosidase [Candidatus Nanopelagicales bacterium]MDP4750811.1 pseudouridine-5'-phosphate glycosidase [Candidatus Nanopelagicales bacterium]MDP4931040.1 pseudouridine-5'-phosphate glycosidase [Candidatus Nanopelagicaceae bacterium]
MIKYSEAVAKALGDKSPIVALESTIITHGLPRPKNLEVALEVEQIVIEAGATPATIAIIDGQIHIGLEPDQLTRIANDENILKASIRDLAVISTQKKSAATTVAATSHIANMAGISLFATGGLGGVHREAWQSWDESADLLALANTPVLIVCSGAKSILDVSATLERLETLSVPILGYKTNKFPGFYLTDSGFELEHRVETARDIAQIWRARGDVAINKSALIVANPVSNQMDKALHDQLLFDGLSKAKIDGVVGKAVTPFLLDYFHTNSKGESLRVNIEIIKANAALAAQIAVALK